MIRRLIGLLVLLVLIFPPVAVAAGVIITRDVTSRMESELDLRMNNIRAELTDIEEIVEDVRTELASAVTPINNVISSLDDLIDDADDLVAGSLTIPGLVLTDFVLGISGINHTIVIPDIPATTLTVPGLSSLRGLYNYLTGVGAAITPAVQGFLLACGVWLVVVYILALYFGLRAGWRMLMGR